MTSTISSLVKMCKISYSYPGCTFVWQIRVVYFLVKYSYLCNKKQDIEWHSAHYHMIGRKSKGLDIKDRLPYDREKKQGTGYQGQVGANNREILSIRWSLGRMRKWRSDGWWNLLLRWRPGYIVKLCLIFLPENALYIIICF